MKRYSERIVCCYLYIISKYGYPPPPEKTIQYIDEMAALGFESIELEGIRDKHLTWMYENRIETKNKIDSLNLKVPYYCTVLPGLGSIDEKEIEKNLELFELGCKTAQVFGSKGVLDNAPLPPYQFPEDIPIVRHYEDNIIMNAGFPKDLKWNDYWIILTETYRTACKIAANYDLEFHMHPCMGVLSATTDGYINFANSVNCSNLKFNLDISNQYIQKDNVILSILRLIDHISYIHISDNRGIKVEHLSIGSGVINFEEIFNTLSRENYKGNIGIDIGGSESDVEDIDRAYIDSADWIQNHI